MLPTVIRALLGCQSGVRGQVNLLDGALVKITERNISSDVKDLESSAYCNYSLHETPQMVHLRFLE